MPKLEVACFSIDSALTAAGHGADRIELCDGYKLGGTTPSIEALEKLKANVRVPIFVMIRPRGDDFVYTDAEVEMMKADIVRFNQLADGFVFGLLDSNNRVDKQANRDLIGLAGGKPCTFHRAFDELKDSSRGLEDVIQCGFRNILTSGGKPTAGEGIAMIASLVQKAGSRISIMPGGSVRSSNIEMLQKQAPCSFFHTSAITSDNEEVDQSEIESIKSKL